MLRGMDDNTFRIWPRLIQFHIYGFYETHRTLVYEYSPVMVKYD